MDNNNFDNNMNGQENPYQQGNPYQNNSYQSGQDMSYAYELKRQQELENKKGLAVGSLVCGVIAVTLCCCIGWLPGVIAIILGVVSLVKKRGGKGMAIGGIVTIDFSSVDTPFFRVVTYDFAKAGYALCIIDTGADHADLTGDYAAVPAEMKAVAAYFGKEVLVEVDEKDFYRELGKIREITGDRAVLRAVHYYNDCRRVVKQVEALENNDFDTFLKLVKESGQSSFMYLQNIDT